MTGDSTLSRSPESPGIAMVPLQLARESPHTLTICSGPRSGYLELPELSPIFFKRFGMDYLRSYTEISIERTTYRHFGRSPRPKQSRRFSHSTYWHCGQFS